MTLTIVPAGNPVYTNALPNGPIFTVTYTAPTSGSTPSSADTSDPDSDITQNVDSTSSSSSTSKGKIAAGVLVPLLCIILAVFGYIKYKRTKQAKKSKTFSEQVDRRMSTISGNWRAVSYAGAEAAVRASMAFPGNRISTASFGNRPLSTMAVESGHAGIGSGGMGGDGSPEMSQIRRPGVGPRMLDNSSAPAPPRASRVSFAADTRFSRAGDPRSSLEARRAGAATRSFHTSYIPPVPQRRPSDSENDEAGAMSPTQTQGALPLSHEDIQSRISAH